MYLFVSCCTELRFSTNDLVLLLLDLRTRFYFVSWSFDSIYWLIGTSEKIEIRRRTRNYMDELRRDNTWYHKIGICWLKSSKYDACSSNIKFCMDLFKTFDMTNSNKRWSLRYIRLCHIYAIMPTSCSWSYFIFRCWNIFMLWRHSIVLPLYIIISINVPTLEFCWPPIYTFGHNHSAEQNNHDNIGSWKHLAIIHDRQSDRRCRNCGYVQAYIEWCPTQL